MQSINFSFDFILTFQALPLLDHHTMSRHNRRRVRLNHGTDQVFLSRTETLISPLRSAQSPQEPTRSATRLPRRNTLSARHWHNRYIAWQAREKKQKEEHDRLEAERRRLFGGDSQDGDDADGLCTKMMDYFVGLDYLKECY